MSKESINIIGYGYVGGAMGHLCEKNNIEFNVCDTQKKEGVFNYFNNIVDLVKFSENNNDINFYIIAVPTNSDSEGNCDISIVKSVLESLKNNVTKETYVIIKSTIVPGTSKELSEKYTNFDIIFCPEFLTEKNYLNDIYNAKFVLLGISDHFDIPLPTVSIDGKVPLPTVSIDDKVDGKVDGKVTKYQKILNVMKQFYKHNTQIDILIRSYEECELFKYTVNNFLAVKVWYFNKIYDISESLGIDYQSFKTLFDLDQRISGYGTRIPGDHGRGYAGTCLRKDQYGMIKLLENLNVDNTVLKSMAAENEKIRKK
jgi:UDPglucose 6-dehydrogenase